eukprot:TRINITY_DN395_c4_g1_i1.p1 TRINITY_DN395_c4_g1~~TRINITY_DN395_c4_g1_i1.p1  ORF type:complete len:473 (+),score=95.79 TRINITY_DN395_c4_g1_i1:39-1421(+)
MRTAAALLCASAALAAPEADLIKELPGYGKPKNPQYSGFLKVNDPQGELYYHYWLARSPSEKDPVVLWMNGGPGASSIGYGLFTEMGPFSLDEESLQNKTTPGIPDVHDNPNAWSNVANMLFLEHPPSVGYSYCGKTGSPKNATCAWNDTTQAAASYGAVKEFFNTFPEFKDNDFFVTGESYGGMYVPTLVEEIYKHQDEVPNLKGFAIGNGIVGHKDTFPGEAGTKAKFFHGKSFMSEQTWDEISKVCGDFNNVSTVCQDKMDAAAKAVGPYYVYNVYDTCGADQAIEQKPWLWTEEQVQSLTRLEQPDSYPCGSQKATAVWMNLPAVREAIHVPSESFYGHQYTLEAGPFLKYDESRPHLLDIYPELTAKYRGLIYNGDFDGCVPYVHAEGWTSSFHYKQSSPWRPWTVDQQVAGYTIRYDHNNFTFATVKGAGHMVPQYKAREALHLITAFINNDEL